MKRLSLYQKTVDILYEAYFNDTLEHGNCYACAVGNIIAANNGYKFGADKESCMTKEAIVVYTGEGKLSWDRDFNFNTNAVRYICSYDPEREFGEEVARQVNSTGYTIKELERIEKAFELANNYIAKKAGQSKDEKMFNGLVNVLNKLKEIHEVEDEVSQLKFEHHYKTKKHETAI